LRPIAFAFRPSSARSFIAESDSPATEPFLQHAILGNNEHNDVQLMAVDPT
jgi:hypothetical protein